MGSGFWYLAWSVYDEWILRTSGVLRPWNHVTTRFLHNCQKGSLVEEALQEQITSSGRLVSLISSFASNADLFTGRQIHALAVNMAWHSDINIVNALIKLYANCDQVEDVQFLFYDMHEKSLVSWNTMISVMCKWPEDDLAINLFNRMLIEGFLPDAYTFSSSISACSGMAACAEGMLLHAQVNASIFKSNVIIGNALVHMYGKCKSPGDARRMFDSMPGKNVVSWNAMMMTYAQNGHDEDARYLFHLMRQEGVVPDKRSCMALLSTCPEGVSYLMDDVLGDLLHVFMSDTSVANALINMYSKQGDLRSALNSFQNIADRNQSSWNILIAGYAHHGQAKEAIRLFYEVQQEGMVPDCYTFATILSTIENSTLLTEGKRLHSLVATCYYQTYGVVKNALLSMYSKCDEMVCARELFETMCKPDVVSWNVLISGYACQGLDLEVHRLVNQMVSEGVMPDKTTVVSTLSAYSIKVTSKDGLRLHARVTGCDFFSDLYVQNSLLSFYGRIGSLHEASAIFDELEARDVVTWNALISAYGQYGRGQDAIQCFHQMLYEGILPTNATYATTLSSCAAMAAVMDGEQIYARIMSYNSGADMMIENAIINMYSECGLLDRAQRKFDRMTIRNSVSWNVIIQAHVRNGQQSEMMHLFRSMQEDGILPDETTFTILLSSVEGERGLTEGESMYSNIVNYGWDANVSVRNALLSMYSRYGRLADARTVFDTMARHNLVSWNSMLTAYAQDGKAKEALDLFDRMKKVDVRPNEVTFIAVLLACSNAGLVDQANHHFLSMIHDYGLDPAVDHYRFVIDLCKRAGREDQVEGLIKRMPLRATSDSGNNQQQAAALVQEH